MSDAFVTPWVVAHQVPLSMGFLRQEYWSGLPFPSPGGVPDLGIKPGSPALQADSLPPDPLGKHKYIQIPCHVYFHRLSLSLHLHLIYVVSQSVQFSHSVVSDSLQPHEPQHARPPCPSPTPGVHPNPYLLS